MRRLISVFLGGVVFWLTSTGSVQRSREREAVALATTRLEQRFGAPRAAVSTPAADRAYWLVSPLDVSPQRALIRGIVDRYTADLLGDAGLRDALTTYLANRLTEVVFQQQIGTTLGASFVVERYFGGMVPYAFRSIRLTADQLAPAEPFDTLERYIGSPTLDAILREFYASRHGTRASRAEFIEACNTISGRDLDWLFRAVSSEDGDLDYGVGQVSSGPSSAGRVRTTIQIRRYGDAGFARTDRLPQDGFGSSRAITVRVAFTDGTTRDEYWDGRSRWTTFVYDSVPAVATVTVDPGRVMAADRRVTNNTWTRTPMAAAAADKWSARWMTWLEDAILGWAFFV